MTTVAVLGTGNVAEALSGKLSDAGYRVVVGSREPVAATRKDWVGASGARISVTALSEAARAGDIVVNGLPGAVSVEVLRELGPVLTGKVLVDIANAVTSGPDGFAESLCYPVSSLAEQIQHALPGVKVVKTLNTVGPASLMVDPTSLPTPLSAFLSGNDVDAKGVVADLLVDLGWPRGWIIDLGDVTTARWPESFILLVRPLVAALGPVPFGLTIAR
ncbi:NADPH-dependent F420 reductase [Micromonospora sp. NPDC003197]